MMKSILLVMIYACIAMGDIQTQRWTFGNFELISICDLEAKGASMAQFFIDGAFGNPISPEVLLPELQRIGYTMETDPILWTVPINTLYIANLETGEEYFVDTGLGMNISRGASQLIESLAALDINPADIDYVFVTHGHGDHSGGLMTEEYKPMFPNATLVMGEDDFKLFTNKTPDWDDFCCPSLLNEDIPWVSRALKNYATDESTNLILLNFTTAPSFDNINNLAIYMSPGHTSDNHMTIRLTSESTNNSFWILGDSFVSGYHMENNTIGCSHDHHRVESMKTRLEFSETFQPNDVLFAMHFAFPGTGKFDGTTFTYLNGSNIFSK